MIDLNNKFYNVFQSKFTYIKKPRCVSLAHHASLKIKLMPAHLRIGFFFFFPVSV